MNNSFVQSCLQSWVAKTIIIYGVGESLISLYYYIILIFNLIRTNETIQIIVWR